MTDPPSQAARGGLDSERNSANHAGHPSSARIPVDTVGHPRESRPLHAAGLSESEALLLGDLFSVVEEHQGDAPTGVDEAQITRAFLFACEHHADQRRKSGEEFITHPVGVAKICAGMRLDTATLCAALLHDTVEDTTASLDEVREQYGEEISSLVDGVTKLTEITFQSRDEAQAENYRKMMVAMASDVRVILIKLADRLHNMRTISAMPKSKQIDKAKETLDIYAPIAHRLGIHAIKWELEDLAFAMLHPRKYQEIKNLVAQQRDEREAYVDEAGRYLSAELQALGIASDISGRAKNFYSIYAKMTRKDREFNEIYDLTAMRVLVGSVEDCYGAVGAIHSLWNPLPGRFKDFIAMPKFNMYQSLHTTVIGPMGRPLEIQIRTHEMHDMAELGVAAHWLYKQRSSDTPSEADHEAKSRWLRQLTGWQQELNDSNEYVTSLKGGLYEDEVFVFTPMGEVKSLQAGATPLDLAYEIHTDLGHRCVGAKVHGKIVPLSYELKSGDIVEILTSKRDRGPSRDWLSLVRTTRARNKIKAWLKAESRKDTELTGRELLQDSLKNQGLPYRKIVGSTLLAQVIREMGFKKAEDFYLALGGAKIAPKLVVSKVMQRLKEGEAAEGDPTAGDLLAIQRPHRQPESTSTEYGIRVEGVEDVLLRLAKCCRPVPGDLIIGYISLGRGITIHREDCPNAIVLAKDPERLTPVAWEGEGSTSFKVEIHVDAWDRHRLLEDLSRALAESGINILEARCLVDGQMVRDRFVVEVADTTTLNAAISRLRNIDAVFDAYRVTPTAA